MGESTGFIEESLPFQAHLSGRVDEAVLKRKVGGNAAPAGGRPLRAWLLACRPPAGFDGAEPPLQRSQPGILLRGPFGCVRGTLSKGRGQRRAAERPSEKR